MTQIGKYKVIECRRVISKDRFWQVNQDGVLDPISQHKYKSDAIAAAKRYQRNDERRAKQSAA